jgi:hypothetical protein
MNGYELAKKCGVPVPFLLALGDGWLARALLHINRFFIFFSKSLFSYQIAVIARHLSTLEHLLDNTAQAQRNKLMNSA